MSLLEHRQAIDALDADIVRLLNERTRHVLEIGAIKTRHGQEIYAPHRERAVFQKVFRHNQGPITNEGLRAIYREIMSCALSLERSLTIAYLGPEATFTHQAALRRFQSSRIAEAEKMANATQMMMKDMSFSMLIGSWKMNTAVRKTSDGEMYCRMPAVE